MVNRYCIMYKYNSYVLNLGHTPVLGHLASAQQDVR